MQGAKVRQFFKKKEKRGTKFHFLKDPMFIPYTDKVLLMYGGGAIGPQSFREDIKEELMKKHPVK